MGPIVKEAKDNGIYQNNPDLIRIFQVYIHMHIYTYTQACTHTGILTYTHTRAHIHTHNLTHTCSGIPPKIPMS